MTDNNADLKQMLHQQLMLMEALTVMLFSSSMGQSNATGFSKSIHPIAGSMADFLYDSHAHITFDSWYKRYEALFSVDLLAHDDAWKVRLLLRQLGPAEHESYANFLLLKNPREITFVDTLKTSSQLFGEHSSLFNTRFQTGIQRFHHLKQASEAKTPPSPCTVARDISIGIAHSANIVDQAVTRLCQTPSTTERKAAPATSNSKRRFCPKRKPKTQSIGNSLSL
ncbi:unnamed protein product [Schistocephalus solidus]|uniref:DUF7083 domain-containing protein n=1 Tax=Schistocephalus solidus TaxID=70667 RepID=A0A183SP14_SCHSO|nr:unnamed protein product [Schistocephalus solidus]